MSQSIHRDATPMLGFRKEGTIIFQCLHENSNWSADANEYTFAQQAGFVANLVTKHSDKTLTIAVSGFHNKAYRFETEMPDCTSNNGGLLTVGLTWSDVLTLYLNGNLIMQGSTVDEIDPAQSLQLARAAVIEGYAGVEESLASLFAALLGAWPHHAAVVFWRLTNTSSRNKIIEQLLTSRFGTQFDSYWHGQKHVGGLFTLIRQLDQTRNELVHWRVRRTFSLRYRTGWPTSPRCARTTSST
jgi:hypothetical protein